MLWIAKFGRRSDRWNHPRVEHGMLALARAAGLRAADSRCETVRGGRATRAPLRPGPCGRRLAATPHGQRAHPAPCGRRRRRPARLVVPRPGRRDPTLQCRSTGRSARAVRAHVLQRGRLESRRSSSQPRDGRGRPPLAAEPGVRPDAVAGDLAGAPRPRDDLRPSRPPCRQGQPVERLRTVPARDDAAAGIFDRIVSTVRARWLHVMRGAGVDAADREAIRGAFRLRWAGRQSLTGWAPGGGRHRDPCRRVGDDGGPGGTGSPVKPDSPSSDHRFGVELRGAGRLSPGGPPR